MRCGKVVAPSEYDDGIDDMPGITTRAVFLGGYLKNSGVETSQDHGEKFALKLLGAGQFRRTRTA
jgi:hypothetical protein